MKKIAIIGANVFQNPLIERAKAMGLETHVFAWQVGDIGERTADYFYPISITEKEAILAECEKIRPDAVLSIGSDLAAVTVNFLADRLGLVGNSLHSCEISTNKYRMREAFQDADVCVPKFCRISEDEVETHRWPSLTDFCFPVIVKPTDRSGSRGVTELTEESGVEDAVKGAIRESFEKQAIIEEYIPGPEYSAEGLSFHGEHRILALTKKYTSGHPHYIESGHSEPADISEKYRTRICGQIERALDALEIKNGASHTEFKLLPNGEIRIIEIGGRMGGDCIGSHLVRLSTGIDYIEQVIRVALGMRPEYHRPEREKFAAIRFLFSEADAERCRRMEELHPNWVVETSGTMRLAGTQAKISDSSKRLGYMIVSTPLEDADEVREMFFEGCLCRKN